MLHFIVDGYNLINKIPKLKNFSLQEKRNNLLHLLNNFKSKISPNNKITVVFDGKADIYSPPNLKLDLEIIFSKGQDADSLIKRMVDEKKRPGSSVVVTDDKAIINHIKSKGVKHKSTSWFLQTTRRKLEKPPEGDDSKLSLKQAYSVNEELKSFWLKKYS